MKKLLITKNSTIPVKIPSNKKIKRRNKGLIKNNIENIIKIIPITVNIYIKDTLNKNPTINPIIRPPIN